MARTPFSQVPLIAVALCLCSSAHGEPLKVRVLYSEIANLTYQLDAASGSLGHLDPVDYQTLWKREFLKTDADRDFLRQWGELKQRYLSSAGLPAPKMPFQPAENAVNLFDRLRVAGLRASKDQEFLDGASLLMTPADANRLEQIVRHFSPAFHLWWRREAEPKGQRFVRRMNQLIGSPQVQKEIERFRRFYAPLLPEGAPAFFSLVYRPDLAKAPTNGQQIGNVGVVEFLPQETPENRLDVVLHEFCHFLYGSRSDASNLSLQRAFAESGDSAAKPSFNLLNEAMATALGNGVIGRMFRPKDTWSAYLARPLSLYNNPSVDRAGKATLQLMDSWLPSGRTIDDPGFVPGYIAALKSTFGESLTSPSLFLSEAYLYVDERFGLPYAREMRRALGVASAYISTGDKLDAQTLESYDGQPGLSAVFVVPAGQLSSLVENKVLEEADTVTIHEQLGKTKSALFARARSANSYTFVVIAEDVNEVKKRIAQLASASRMFTGVLP